MTTSSCSRNPRFHLPSWTTPFQENDVDAVSINNVQGTSKAVSHLCGMGHREIGYIRSKVRINSFDERYNAFKHKLRGAWEAFSTRSMWLTWGIPRRM